MRWRSRFGVRRQPAEWMPDQVRHNDALWACGIMALRKLCDRRGSVTFQWPEAAVRLGQQSRGTCARRSAEQVRGDEER